MDSPRSSNSAIWLHRKIHQLEKQLELSKKTVKKLRKDKKALSKKIDKIRGEKGKLETQLNWKNLEFKRRQKENETNKRHELWKLKNQLYGKNRNNNKNKNNQSNNDSNDNNNYLLQQINFQDPEINEVFNKVYKLEHSIQKSLEKFDLKKEKYKKVSDCLDNSFETISLLLQESKTQKAIIRQLNEKINTLCLSNKQFSNKFNELKLHIINNNDHDEEKYDDNKYNDKCINDNFEEQIRSLQKSNIEYQSEIHSMEFEIERLKTNNIICRRQIESFQLEIENFQTISESTTYQINLMTKRIQSIQFERDELRKQLNKRNILNIQKTETTNCF